MRINNPFVIIILHDLSKLSTNFRVFMSFFERFELLLNTKNVSRSQLAKDLQIRTALISEWKKNGNLPNGETAIKIANYFDISLDYLLTGKLKNELPDEDAVLLVRYHNLSPENKAAFNQLLKTCSSK